MLAKLFYILQSYFMSFVLCMVVKVEARGSEYYLCSYRDFLGGLKEPLHLTEQFRDSKRAGCRGEGILSVHFTDVNTSLLICSFT